MSSNIFIEHPAKVAAYEPTRVPDYSSTTYEIYFKEMIVCILQSDGEYQPALLNICPITGRLMYMPQHWPVAWYFIDEERAHEAYIRHNFEKVILNAQD